MSLLFDTFPEESQKRRGRKQATKAEPAEQPAVRSPLLPVSTEAQKPLGTLDAGVPCIDSTCLAECHDVTDEDRGQWRLECCFCGTGQWIKAIPGHLPEPAEGGDFVFRGGRCDGLTIAEAARTARGIDYIKWAAKEHPRPAVKTACEKWLASSGTVG
jgi:hypothetical protein